jgi:hypothetical protein
MEMIDDYCGRVIVHVFDSSLCCVDVIQDDFIGLDYPICLRRPFPPDVYLSGTHCTTSGIVDIRRNCHRNVEKCNIDQ